MIPKRIEKNVATGGRSMLAPSKFFCKILQWRLNRAINLLLTKDQAD